MILSMSNVQLTGNSFKSLVQTITKAYHRLGGVKVQKVRSRKQKCTDLLEKGHNSVLGHVQVTLLRALDVLHNLATDGEVSLIQKNYFHKNLPKIKTLP